MNLMNLNREKEGRRIWDLIWIFSRCEVNRFSFMFYFAFLFLFLFLSERERDCYGVEATLGSYVQLSSVSKINTMRFFFLVVTVVYFDFL